MTYAILGMGRYGSKIAETVKKTGAQIIVADSDKSVIDGSMEQYTYAVAVDFTNAEAVAEIGLTNADIVVIDRATSLEESVICTMVSKEQGVDKVIATARNARHSEILMKMGADEVIIPEEEAAMRMARTLISEDFMEYIDIGEGLCVIKIHPIKAWVGKPITELNLRKAFDANIVAIEENGVFTCYFDVKRKLLAEDRLLLAINKKNVMEFI